MTLKHLRGRQFRTNEDSESVVREYLRKKQTDFYCDGSSELVLGCDKCINMLKNYAKK